MKQKIIPIAAIVVGLLAFVLTSQLLTRKLDEYNRLYKERIGKLREIMVVVAARDLPSGSTIGYPDLAQSAIFEEYATDRIIPAADVKLLIGRKIVAPLKAERPILWSDIEGGSPSDQGLAPIVSKGMRAISLSISGAAGVSGMVQPNDRVDVLGTFSFPAKDGKTDELVTLTMLQDVTVLAVGQTLSRQSLFRGQQRNAGYSTVTIEVTPREAEVLVFAQQIQGRLTLALRNPNDIGFESELPDVNFQHIEKKLPDLNNYRQKNIRRK